MQLEGTLAQFPLRELIEMVTYSSVAGALELRVGDDIGQLFFCDGRPYHAVAGEQTGMNAVFQLFEQQDSSFRFVADKVSAEETIWMDSWELIERGEQHAKLWERVRPRIPSLDWVPVLCGNTGSEQVHIDEDIWPVLSVIDGQRNIHQVAEVVQMEPLGVCGSLVEMLDQRLITIRPPRSALVVPPSDGHSRSASANNHSLSGGFFERLISKLPTQEDAAVGISDVESTRD